MDNQQQMMNSNFEESAKMYIKQLQTAHTKDGRMCRITEDYLIVKFEEILNLEHPIYEGSFLNRKEMTNMLVDCLSVDNYSTNPTKGHSKETLFIALCWKNSNTASRQKGEWAALPDPIDPLPGLDAVWNEDDIQEIINSEENKYRFRAPHLRYPNLSFLEINCGNQQIMKIAHQSLLSFENITSLTLTNLRDIKLLEVILSKYARQLKEISLEIGAATRGPSVSLDPVRPGASIQSVRGVIRTPQVSAFVLVQCAPFPLHGQG